MTKALQDYAVNKIISLAWVGVVIFASWLWLGYSDTQWRFILLTLITFGYAHFLIGFYYQVRGFFRKSNPWQQVFVFLVLALSSVIVAEVLFSYIGFAFGLFFGFAYFLLHGLFNEQTLLEREGGVLVPLGYIASLAIFVMTQLTYTIPDPTFLFDRTLTFLSVDNFIFVQAFLQMGVSLGVFPYIFWFGVVASFLTLGLSWLHSRQTALSIYFAFSYALVTIVTVLFGAVPYVYMYFLVVGYHFMTWFLFYTRVMHTRGKPVLQQFLWLHAVVLLPFLFGFISMMQESPAPVAELLFDYKYFVIATYIHISTSFMNDQWFQKLQVRLLG